MILLRSPIRAACREWYHASVSAANDPLFDQLRLLEQQGGTPAAREKVLRQVSEQAAADTWAKLAQDLHDSIKQQLFSITISTARRHRLRA